MIAMMISNTNHALTSVRFLNALSSQLFLTVWVELKLILFSITMTNQRKCETIRLTQQINEINASKVLKSRPSALHFVRVLPDFSWQTTRLFSDKKTDFAFSAPLKLLIYKTVKRLDKPHTTKARIKRAFV
jgi:hypothetical protein